MILENLLNILFLIAVMQILNYILTAFFANLGIVFGIILAYIAKEEVDEGRNYFIIIQNLIVIMILAVIMKMLGFHAIVVIVVFILALMGILYAQYKKKSNKKLKDRNETIKRAIIYTLMGAAFYISSRDIPYFIIIASMVFLYGFPSGTLATDFKKPYKWKVILSSSSFFITAIVLYIIAHIAG